jgi:putative Holliday junction resolvase
MFQKQDQAPLRIRVCLLEFVLASEIASLKNSKNRLLGIDHGEKHVGLSLCDLTWTIASPFKVLSKPELLQQFQKLVSQENIVAVVIGWPVNMNGTVGPQCEKVQQFSEKLIKVFNIPFCAWDERLSTMAVHRTMIEADLSRKRQREVVDKMAAAYMLQGFLESLRG